MNYALDELKQLRQWVAWRLEWDAKQERKTKPPYNIHTNRHADKTNPADWASYDEVIDYAMRKGLIQSKAGGVGFCFTEDTPYAGIDLDHVIHDGKLIPEAEEIVTLMDSYTEYSPSGDGLHILFKLNQPLTSFMSRHKIDFGVASRFEIYDSAWYFTVSGKPYGDVKPIAERTAQCRQICAKLSAQQQQQQAQKTTPNPDRKNTLADWKYNPDNYRTDTPSPVATKDLSDTQLWQRMFDSTRGTEIQALYNGDTSRHGNDPSSADLALCSYLNYWTEGDASRIDSMFRQSVLMRKKWDEPHNSNGDTYGQITINRAINGEQPAYSGYQSIPVSSNSQNSTDMQQEQGALPQEGGTLGAYLSCQFNNDILSFTLFKNRKIGFDNFDKFNSLYPGLYILGGVSGCGKTTFCHQIADNLARAGEYVLFFSLEQTQFELASKGISRITAQEDYSLAKTALDIRNGRITDTVNRAIRIYRSFAEREFIIECGFDYSVDTLIATVKDFIAKTGIKPVVFLDYLQILKPSKNSERKPLREAIDDTVHALKKLQVDNGLVTFVISSFNRTNYLQIADFESFKESGGLEYSADVIMALQLLAMNADIFDKEAKLQSKRYFVREAKNDVPRKIELLTLKNRYGRANTRYFFNYYPQFDMFTPYDISEDQADDEVQAAAEAFKEKHKQGGNGNSGNRTASL